jgi:hypothetical protein
MTLGNMRALGVQNLIALLASKSSEARRCPLITSTSLEAFNRLAYPP